MEYGADQRHAELILQELELVRAKPMSTPGTVDRLPEDGDGAELTSRDGAMHRRLVARLSYIAQHRPDVQRATKELCRHLADPRQADLKAMKRLARYLVRRERLILRYDRQQAPSKTVQITSVEDADFAGRMAARKSTSGGVLMNGKPCLKT